MVDAGRQVVFVGARADEERQRPRRPVAAGKLAQHPLNLDLPPGLRQGEVALQPLVGGNVGKQRFDVGDTDARQHGAAVLGRKRQIAHHEPSLMNAS